MLQSGGYAGIYHWADYSLPVGNIHLPTNLPNARYTLPKNDRAFDLRRPEEPTLRRVRKTTPSFSAAAAFWHDKLFEEEEEEEEARRQSDRFRLPAPPPGTAQGG